VPDKNNFIVLYIPERDDFIGMRTRFEEFGHSPVELENSH
jgi:hypothetical protein